MTASVEPNLAKVASNSPVVLHNRWIVEPKRCRKMRYPDRVGALLALAVLQRQDKPGHTERRAYKCPRCKGWHLTSQGRRS